MRCTSPLTVGRKADGVSLAFSPRQASKEYATTCVGCGKCLDCRLEHARQWAARCEKEAMVHSASSFINLTYADPLPSAWLNYRDWQLFAKRLRRRIDNPVSILVCGEYGELNKRPHWHALIFGYQFPDLVFRRSNEHGDRLFTSEILESLWSFNDKDRVPNEVGAVTFKSAGYVCRYQAKKLKHGFDGSHPYKPIFRASNKRAIGRAWLEEHWQDVFSHGRLVLEGGVECAIPRYFEKWFYNQGHNEDGSVKDPYFFAEWRRYVTEVKPVNEVKASEREAEERAELELVLAGRRARTAGDGAFRGWPTTRAEARRAITEANFKRLSESLGGSEDVRKS